LFSFLFSFLFPFCFLFVSTLFPMVLTSWVSGARNSCRNAVYQGWAHCTRAIQWWNLHVVRVF
jgi:TRAP-type mannitol/chloroaromatic compound transport system permease small subunit